MRILRGDRGSPEMAVIVAARFSPALSPG